MMGFWNLDICLCTLNFNLKAEWFITGGQITWLATYWIFLHVNTSHLQFMCLGISWLKRWLLFIVQTGKMTIFVTGLALKHPSRTLETFYILGVTTLWTSISSFVCLALIKLLKDGLWFLCSLEYLFWLFDLCLWECCFHLDLLGGRSTLWCLIRLTWATWGSLAAALTCLVVGFEDSIILASCLSLLAWNFSRSIWESFMVLETNSSSFRKKTRIYLYARYLQFLVGTWQETL